MTTANINLIAKQIRSIPKLDAEREYELALRAQKGDEAAVNQLVEANLRHALNIGLKYRHYGIPVEELIAEGTLGLLTAVRKFDPARGVRFVTYAGYWIRAFVLDKVVQSKPIVGGGSGPFRSKLFFRLRREKAQAAAQTSDRNEQLEIIAKRLDLKPAKVAELYQRLNASDVSLDTPLDAASATTVGDMLESNAASPEAEAMEAKDGATLRDAIADALKVLDEREALIIRKRHLHDTPMSLAAIGRLLGISRERARQLETRAKDKLRANLFEFAPMVDATFA